MRNRVTLAVLLALALVNDARAGPDDYVFEFRLLNEDGREIVATCRGQAPCVLDEGLRGRVNFAVQVEVTSANINIGVSGYRADFVVRNANRSDLRDLLIRRPGRWIAVPELPAVLRVIRYEPGGPGGCRAGQFCNGTERRVGSGYLTIRPLPPASGASDAR